MPKKQQPKIVLWDLETIPDMEEAMKVWTGLGNYPGLTLKASISSIICFGYKIYGEGKKAKCLNAWDYKGWQKNINDDRPLVEAAYEILKDADCIVTHNGKKFDLKHFQTRLIKHGLPPLPPIAHVDTRHVASKKLYTFNNRLNTLGDFLVNEKKMDHEGWELWVKVSKRDPQAMKKMTAYCKQDVQLLEKIFHRLRAHSTEIPNHNLFSISETNSCPNCGGSRLRSNGWRFTSTRKYRRYVCIDCGTYSRTDAHNEKPRTF
jgi:DNA polymerase elongation subunit (family B)